VGVRPQRFGDLYHSFLKLSWTQSLGVLAIAYLILNVVFASRSSSWGGVQNAAPGSFRERSRSASRRWDHRVRRDVPFVDGCRSARRRRIDRVAHLHGDRDGLIFARFTRIVSRVLFTTDAVIGRTTACPPSRSVSGTTARGACSTRRSR